MLLASVLDIGLQLVLGESRLVLVMGQENDRGQADGEGLGVGHGRIRQGGGPRRGGDKCIRCGGG